MRGQRVRNRARRNTTKQKVQMGRLLNRSQHQQKRSQQLEDV
jgi:hypothetical protein